MDNDMSYASDLKEISYPRFAAFYNRVMGQALVRRMFDPLRRETAGQAHGIVLEVGAGGGQNFPFYEKSRVVRVEAVEPDEAMLVSAGRSLADAAVPIRLSRAPVEALPFPDAHFDSAVVTLVFCSVRDPWGGLREIWRVLKPGGHLVAPRTCSRTRKKSSMGTGCARATDNTLHGQLPLEPRYLAHGSGNRLPGHTGPPDQWGTPANAAPACDAS